MKLTETTSNVFISDNLKVKNFSIKINKQSFKLLYGDLYSDKIKAIIRELSTNAADSHTAAGKTDVPFEVHLPNDLEPNFYVKDYGTGMSPDMLEGIYSTFCDSNKTHSDEFTGCLGLGSKSPFAYTDNFIVESRWNGKAYTYGCFMNSDGEPSMAQMGESETSEPNGVKIEFAVQQKDFGQFHGKSQSVLNWFKVKPNVVGVADFEWDGGRQYLRSTDRYGVHKENTGESRVIMGNVAYPITAHDFSYSKIDDVERQVIDWGVDLFLDIGDVDFVPSREKLSYNDRTINGVKRYLKDAIASIREELEAQVATQSSMWKARRMLHDIKHSILGKVRNLSTVMYQGKEIAEYINFHPTVEKTMGLTRDNPLYPKCEVLALKKENYRRRDEDVIYCDTGRVYFNDLEHGGLTRIQNDLSANSIRTAFVLTGVNADFFAATGIDEVLIKVSSLPKPERKQRVTSDGKTVSGYVKRTVLTEYGHGGNYSTEWWKDIEVDIKAGGVYVVVSYGKIMGSDGKATTLPSEIKRKYNAVKALRPDFKLYGIRPAHMGKMERYKNRWIKFEEYATAVLKAEEAKFMDKCVLLAQYSNIRHKDRYDRFLNYSFDPHSYFGNFIAKYRSAKEAFTDVQVKAVMVLNNCVTDSFVVPESSELRELEDGVKEHYPLLEYMEWWNGSDQFNNAVAEYVFGLDDRKVASTKLAVAV